MLSILLHIVIAIGLSLWQLSSFLLKIVPLGIIFPAINKTVAGFSDLSGWIASTTVSSVMMVIFIVLFGIVIWIGLYHIILNINIFSNLTSDLAERDKSTNKKRVRLSPSLIKNFRIAFLNYVNKTGSETGDRIGNFELIQKSPFIMWLLFQTGAIRGSKLLQSLRKNIFSVGGVFGLLFLGLFVWSLSYTSELTTVDGRKIEFSNGYEYIQKTLPSSSFNIMSSSVGSLIREDTSYVSNRIKLIAKAYHKVSLMGLISNVDLVQRKVVNTNEDNSKEIIGVGTIGSTTNELSRKSISSLLSVDGGGNKVNAKEYMSKVHNKDGYVASGVLECIKYINGAGKQLRDQYLVPLSYYSSNSFASGKPGTPITSDTTKNIIKGGSEMKKLGIVAPSNYIGTPVSSKKIGAYFYVRNNAGQWVVSKKLLSDFKSRVTSVNKGLLEANHNISSFCYAYGVAKASSVNKYNPAKTTLKSSNIEIYDYDNYVNGRYGDVLRYIKSNYSDYSESKQKQLAYYITTNARIDLGNNMDKYLKVLGDVDSTFIEHDLFVKGATSNPRSFLVSFIGNSKQLPGTELNTNDVVVREALARYLGVLVSNSKLSKRIESEVRGKGIEVDGNIFGIGKHSLASSAVKGYKGGVSEIINHPSVSNLIAESVQGNGEITTQIDENNKNTELFFGKRVGGNDVNESYEQQSVMIGILPIVETQSEVLDIILAITYFILIGITLLVILRLSGIIGFFVFLYNAYYPRKNKGEREEEDKTKLSEEFMYLVLRIIGFYFIWKLYLIFTII